MRHRVLRGGGARLRLIVLIVARPSRYAVGLFLVLKLGFRLGGLQRVAIGGGVNDAALPAPRQQAVQHHCLHHGVKVVRVEAVFDCALKQRRRQPPNRVFVEEATLHNRLRRARIQHRQQRLDVGPEDVKAVRLALTRRAQVLPFIAEPRNHLPAALGPIRLRLTGDAVTPHPQVVKPNVTLAEVGNLGDAGVNDGV